MLQDVAERVGKAFDGFFGTTKSRENRSGVRAGYPRFKSWREYDSITFKQTTGWKLTEVKDATGRVNPWRRRLTLQGIGSMKLFWSRDLEGTIKTVTLKRDVCGDWFVSFSCDEVPLRLLPPTGEDIGCDLGLESFMATSDSRFVANPRYYKKAESSLARSQRKVSRRKKGSSRRRKTVRVLAHKHRKVARSRKDHQTKLAVWLVRNFDMLAFEKLNVLGLSRGMLSKGVHDASWGRFLSILSFKAIEAGRRLLLVDPNGTSQRCSRCNHVPAVKKTLKDRIHHCSQCGLRIHRDTNAAINILKLAYETLVKEAGDKVVAGHEGRGGPASRATESLRKSRQRKQQGQTDKIVLQKKEQAGQAYRLAVSGENPPHRLENPLDLSMGSVKAPRPTACASRRSQLPSP